MYGGNKGLDPLRMLVLYEGHLNEAGSLFPGKSLLRSLNRRLGGTQNRSEHFEKETGWQNTCIKIKLLCSRLKKIMYDFVIRINNMQIFVIIYF
jgi:hypothetical protein